ncbi:MAG: ABC transporter permease [Polyangiaceae bacterium]|nr:ABC transporter permease [Polyangiaceae bacterium]
MNTLRIAASSLRALGRYRLRTALMMLGTLVGVAALTFVLTAGQAASSRLADTVRQLFGASSIVVSAGGGFFLGGPRDAARLTVDDIEAVVREVPGIEVWDPALIAPDTPVRRAERSASVRLMGLSERSERVWNRTVSRGSYFDAIDVARAARVAVIGATVARALFPGEDPIGQELSVDAVPFRVAGVLERFGTDVHGFDRDNEIVVPVTTVMRRVKNVDSITAAKFLVGDPDNVESVSREVTLALRERHRLARGQPDDFTVTSSVAVREIAGRVQRVLFFYLPLVSGASLLAALALAASLMLASVSGRTTEIGLRRAVGARSEDISLQFLLETAVTTLLGGALGLILGGGAAWLVARLWEVEVSVTPGAIALGLGLSLATGFVAGIAPARRAAQLNPVDALR